MTTRFNLKLNELVETALLGKDQKVKTEDKINETTVSNMEESAKSQDFFQDNNAIEVKYTATRIKSRFFLANIPYVGINKEDYCNKNFVFDVSLLLTKNLNPFSLDRKLNKTKHKLIYMLWREYMLLEFYKFICEEKNFVYLNGKNVLQPKLQQIVGELIEKGEKKLSSPIEQLILLQEHFSVCVVCVYPDIYSSTEKSGFNLKSNFHIMFKTYKDKMQMYFMGKPYQF